MGWRRAKRLTEMPLPEAMRVSFERCERLERPEILVWAESTNLTIDRLLHDYRENLNIDTIWDAHHHALQLVGMTTALVNRSGKIEFERPPT